MVFARQDESDGMVNITEFAGTAPYLHLLSRYRRQVRRASPRIEPNWYRRHHRRSSQLQHGDSFRDVNVSD